MFQFKPSCRGEGIGLVLAWLVCRWRAGPGRPSCRRRFPYFLKYRAKKTGVPGGCVGKAWHLAMLLNISFHPCGCSGHVASEACDGTVFVSCRYSTEKFSGDAGVAFLLQKMSQQGAIVFQKGVHFRQESGGRKRAACSGEDGVHLSTMNKKIFYHVSVDAGAGEGRAAPGQCCNCLRHAGSFPARGRPCAASRLRIFGEMDLSGALPVACAWGPVQGNRKGRAGRPCLPVCLRGTAQCSRMT